MDLHITMTSRALLGGGALIAFVSGMSGVTHAESAYITQVNSKAGATMSAGAAQPVQVVPTSNYAPRQTAWVPTPETASVRSTNLAKTLEIGNSNSVLQAQAGGKNYSNVGVLGGNQNNVAVLQGGNDFSNLQLVNTQGLAVLVAQPPGSAPINMLVAKLPNGSILIKR
jgi:hypothetical protein